MTLSQAVPNVVGEIVESIELAPRNGFHLEPRCRICRTTTYARRSTTCWPLASAMP